MSTDVTVEEAESGGGVLRYAGLFILFLALLVVFTAVKVPQPKIQAWLLGVVNQQISPMGIQASAEEGHLELGLGLKYEMTGVRLTTVSDQKVLKFSRLEVAPDILVPLLQGKVGARFRLEEGSGSISGDVRAKGDEVDANIQIENVNLGRMGILPFATGLEGTADLKGSIVLSGSPSAASAMGGKIDLFLSKIVIDEQKFKGFDIPRTSIGDGVFDIDIGGGKATINTARLGKPNGADDIQGTVTGEIKLNKTIDSSDANLHVKFGFSDRYRGEHLISLLESLITNMKKSDSTYALRLNGPLFAMTTNPEP